MKLASSDPLPETAPEPVAAETSEKVVPSFATETSTPSNTAFLQAIYFLLLLQNKSAEGAYYYITDHLGAPQVITDDSGSVVWKAEYLPFGNVNILTADIENNLRFPGQYYDAETGLYYNWNRYYDPETGRYIAADPIGLDGGINLYAYVGGSPINAVDLEGLRSSDCVGCHPANPQSGADDGCCPGNPQNKEAIRNRINEIEGILAGLRSGSIPGKGKKKGKILGVNAMCNFLSGRVDFTEESVGLVAACLAGYRIGTAFRESCTSRKEYNVCNNARLFLVAVDCLVGQYLDLFVAKATGYVIVHHSHRLHECVADRWTDEVASSLLQILAHCDGQFCFHWKFCHRLPDVLLWNAIDIAPEIRIQ